MEPCMYLLLWNWKSVFSFFMEIFSWHWKYSEWKTFFWNNSWTNLVITCLKPVRIKSVDWDLLAYWRLEVQLIAPGLRSQYVLKLLRESHLPATEASPVKTVSNDVLYVYAKTVCGKPYERVSPILVTLTSRSDSNFERSNVSLKENKRDGVDSNSNGFGYCARKNEGKIIWFSADW